MKRTTLLIFILLCTIANLAVAQDSPQTARKVVVGIANDTVTGTTRFRLAKLTGAPSKAVIAATSDTDGVVGIVTSNAGTSLTASIQTEGLVNCDFDAATTAGNYVQISSTVGGKCRDAGSSYPSTGQVLGRVLSTNGSSGTYQMLLWPIAKGMSASTVSTTGSPANGNLTKFSSATTITNADLSGDVTTSGGTAATLTNSGTARTNLGATTVGGSFFTLTNPSAIAFPKINADNSVTAETAATHRTSIGLGSVDNTSDAAKPVSTAQQTALDTKQATIMFGTGVQTALGVNVGSAGAPVLFNGAGGTPSSLVGTNITGTASGLTAGNVTTNANLTGPITSTGNATAVAAQTGTGSTFVMQASPTLTTPNIGVATATSINFGGAALANYVEGTWTPVVTFGGATTGITYTTQVGWYTRIGNVVTVWCRVVLTSKGSATGTATITGLPVAATSTADRIHATDGGVWDAATYTGAVKVYVSPSATTTIGLFIVNNGSTTVMDNTNFANNTVFEFTLSYRTN